MVHFIGAGPGDPELLTIKGKKLIDQAEFLPCNCSGIKERIYLTGSISDSYSYKNGRKNSNASKGKVKRSGKT